MACTSEQAQQLRAIVGGVCARYSPAAIANLDAADPVGCRVLVRQVPHALILEFPHEMLVSIVAEGFRLLNYASSADQNGGNFEFAIGLPAG